MSGYVLKPAGRVHRHRAHFCGPLLKRDEEIREDLGWIVQGTPPDKRVFFLSDPELGPDWAEITLHGGTPGAIYMLTAQVRTSQNRTLRQSFVVRVTA